jgi:hypothetical protein
MTQAERLRAIVEPVGSKNTPEIRHCCKGCEEGEKQTHRNTRCQRRRVSEETGACTSAEATPTKRTTDRTSQRRRADRMKGEKLELEVLRATQEELVALRAYRDHIAPLVDDDTGAVSDDGGTSSSLARNIRTANRQFYKDTPDKHEREPGTESIPSKSQKSSKARMLVDSKARTQRMKKKRRKQR